MCPIPAITQEAARADVVTLDKAASVNNIATPAAGDLNIGCVNTGHGQVVVKDENAIAGYVHGPIQDLVQSVKGALATIKCSEVELDCTGASVTATGIFPAKVHQLGVVVRVTEVITGAASFNIGDGSDADRYGAAIGLTLGTQSNQASFTADPRGWSASAANVVLTAVSSNFTDGKVRVTAFYIEFTGPTA